MSRVDKLNRLFWKPQKSDLTYGMERIGNLFMDSSDSNNRFCPECEKPIAFEDDMAFCNHCGTKVVKKAVMV